MRFILCYDDDNRMRHFFFPCFHTHTNKCSPIIITWFCFLSLLSRNTRSKIFKFSFTPCRTTSHTFMPHSVWKFLILCADCVLRTQHHTIRILANAIGICLFVFFCSSLLQLSTYYLIQAQNLMYKTTDNRINWQLGRVSHAVFTLLLRRT